MIFCSKPPVRIGLPRCVAGANEFAPAGRKTAGRLLSCGLRTERAGAGCAGGRAVKS